MTAEGGLELTWSSNRGCSSMVEQKPSKLMTRVRFPSPAPIFSMTYARRATTKAMTGYPAANARRTRCASIHAERMIGERFGTAACFLAWRAFSSRLTASSPPSAAMRRTTYRHQAGRVTIPHHPPAVTAVVVPFKRTSTLVSSLPACSTTAPIR